VSFLNQLKSQAKALQTQQIEQQLDLEANLLQTETACRHALHYLQDLAQNLNVIEPGGAKFSLDGKTPWPAMKSTEFRVDARKKMLRGREVYDYLAMGWRIVPRAGEPVSGIVSVNFPPDLQRVEARLALGLVKHERKELRHPVKNSLQAIQFEYLTETRGNVVVTPDHDRATLAFRLLNTSGFGTTNTSFPTAKVKHELLDELAKLIVCESNSFC
jgi:hypothetical protein